MTTTLGPAARVAMTFVTLIPSVPFRFVRIERSKGYLLGAFIIPNRCTPLESIFHSPLPISERSCSLGNRTSPQRAK
jgi:hypothetical protein